MRPTITTVSLAAAAFVMVAAGAWPCGAPSSPSSLRPLSAPIQGVSITPNPWRTDRNAGQSMHFAADAELQWVMLFSTSGRWVRTLYCHCQSSRDWDLRNDAGQLVRSGIYLYLMRDIGGHQTRGTVAVLR